MIARVLGLVVTVLALALAGCDQYTMITGRNRFEDRDAGAARRRLDECQDWADAEYRSCLDVQDVIDEKHPSHRREHCEADYRDRMENTCRRGK